MNKIDARKLSPDALKVLRRQALHMRETLQLPWREIVRVMGVHVTTMLAWAQRYASEGEAGLKFKKPGRAYLSGRTLNLGQEWVLRTVITSESPSVRGLYFALWNRRAVGQLVQQLFGIEMPIRTVGEYLMRWSKSRWTCSTGCRTSTPSLHAGPRRSRASFTGPMRLLWCKMGTGCAVTSRQARHRSWWPAANAFAWRWSRR